MPFFFLLCIHLLTALVLGFWFYLYPVKTGFTVNIDSLFGIIQSHAWQTGFPWNHLPYPPAEDISLTHSAYVTWWPPIPWMAMHFWLWAGLSLYKSLIATTCLSIIAGMAGWLLLYRRLGYNALVASCSLLCISLSLYISLKFADYHGAEILFFAALPWIGQAVLYLGFRWSCLPLLILLLLAGSQLKLSFTISAAAILAALGLESFLSGTKFRTLALQAFFAAAAWFLFYFLLSHLFLRWGYNPSNVFEAQAMKTSRFWGGPLSFILSAETFADRYLTSQGTGLMTLWNLLTAMVVATLIVAVWPLLPGNRARSWLLAFVLINLAAMFFLALRGNRVWFNDRHFMPSGLLLLPALIQLMFYHRTKVLRAALFLLLFLFSSYSFLHTWRKADWMNVHTTRGPSGIRHLFVTTRDMATYLELESRMGPDALTVFSNQEVASLCLETPASRCYIPEYASLHGILNDKQVYTGKASPLLIVGIPDNAMGFKADELKQDFQSYRKDQWKKVPSDTLVLWISAQP